MMCIRGRAAPCLPANVALPCVSAYVGWMSSICITLFLASYGVLLPQYMSWCPSVIWLQWLHRLQKLVARAHSCISNYKVLSIAGSKKRDVEYCAMNLDEAVLAQSLADTAAVLSQNGGETELAMHTAVAMLLEKDDSDDEKPDAKGVSSSTGATEQAKPEQ